MMNAPTAPAADNGFPCTVPDGTSGDWKVYSRTVDDHEAKFANLRAAVNGRSEAYVRPGTYKVLARGGEVFMSNTPMEKRTNLWPLWRADAGAKSFLVTGLGLGIVASLLLRRPHVERVTVLELSPDVVALVAPHVADPRLEVIQADAFTWKPPAGSRWDVAWHDIWADMSVDNLPEMTKLKRRFRAFCGVQECWAADLCRRERRRGGWR